ncbi:MAG: hypothetical protein EBU66_19295 [Bacteroidetes bacterium]|nr:hypothetical protein [Bacteroidota bacterium]
MNSNPVRNNIREPVNVSIPMSYQSRPQNQNSKISMKGPSNVDDLLREFETASNIDNDRIEMLSVITESELQDLDDSSSINGILMNSTKKGKNKKNKITLDI